MFRTCLSSKQAWPCDFLKSSRHFGCRARFWRPCTFACVPARLYSISCSTATLACFYSGWAVFLTLPLTRDCIFFSQFESSFKSSGFLLFIQEEVLQAVLEEWIGLHEATPAKVKKSGNCLRFLLRFAFGLGKLNETKNPSISVMQLSLSLTFSLEIYIYIQMAGCQNVGS